MSGCSVTRLRHERQCEHSQVSHSAASRAERARSNGRKVPGPHFSGLWRGEGRSLGAWKTAQAELRDNRKRRGVVRSEWEKEGVEAMSL